MIRITLTTGDEPTVIRTLDLWCENGELFARDDIDDDDGRLVTTYWTIPACDAEVVAAAILEAADNEGRMAA
jgi:hypothetical protein